MADFEELGLCGVTPSKLARKKHQVQRTDDKSKKQRRSSQSASSSSYTFAAIQAERTRAHHEQERLKTFQANELRNQQESAQRREKELLNKQKELQRQLIQKSSSSLAPADMAYEKLLTFVCSKSFREMHFLKHPHHHHQQLLQLNGSFKILMGA